MLVKIAQLFDRNLSSSEITLRAPGGKYEMISLRKDKLESDFNNFSKVHRRNYDTCRYFF